MSDDPAISAQTERRPLAVIIVNYRTAGLALAAARSTIDDLRQLGGALVLVDNDSRDGSADALSAFKRQHAAIVDVEFVAAPKNGGFAAGVNIGVAAVEADHYLLLNSDAIAESGALQSMLEAARSAPGAGLVTPRILNRAGALEVSRFRRQSPLGEFVDGAASGPVTRRFSRAETPIAADDWTTPPDWVSFAAVLVSRAAIEAAGPMDEGYFLYFEDCDYCERIARAGYSIACAPDAVFRHDPGGSTGLGAEAAKGGRLPDYYYRARNRYFRRFFGPAGSVCANLCWYAGRMLALVRGAFGRPAPLVPKGRALDLWIGWRK